MNLHFLTRLSLTLFPVLACLNLTAQAFGSRRPPHAELAGFTTGCENQPQPCWYGIVPGITLIGDAWSQLERLGYETGGTLSDRSVRFVSFKRLPKCAEIYYDHEATRISSLILSCGTLTIGDLMTLLGSPTNRLWHSEQDTDWPVDRVMLGLAQVWPQSPFVPVGRIRLVRMAGVVAEADLLQPWRGFLPRWRYCQLEPVFAGCR